MGRRYVSKNEKGSLYWNRGDWVGCLAQWRYTCWRSPEKVTQLVNWGFPEKLRCNGKDSSENESWKGSYPAMKRRRCI